MKTASTWNFRSIVGKIMLGLVLVSMIGSIDVLPALGRDYYRGRGYYNHRVYRHYGYYGHSGYYGHRAYYPGPPVYYAPPPPPGIRFFAPPLYVGPY